MTLVVTQNLFSGANNSDGGPIVFNKIATNLPPLLLRKQLGIKPRSAALNIGAESEIAP